MPDKADIDTLLDEMGVDDIEDVNGSVHADIGPEKKVRWMAYAAEHYRGNLTALIEEAVDKELNDNYVLASEDTASGDITAAPSEELTDDLNEIKQQVTALSTQVDTLTSGDTDELDRNERIRLGNRIRMELPRAPSEWAFTELLDEYATIEKSERAMITGRAEDLAEHLDEPRHHIQDAAIFLENQEDAVKSVIDDGVRRWYVHDSSVTVDDSLPEDDDALDDVDVEDPRDLDPNEVFQTGNEYAEEDK